MESAPVVLLIVLSKLIPHKAPKTVKADFTSDRVGVVSGVVVRAYDLVKITNRSRERSHKRHGIGVRRMRTFKFASNSAYDSVAYVPLMI